MRYADPVIPLVAAWSSPFVRWQGPAADISSLDLAEQVTRRALERTSIEWSLDELVLGITIPQQDAFYGAPTLAARLGFAGVSARLPGGPASHRQTTGGSASGRSRGIAWSRVRHEPTRLAAARTLPCVTKARYPCELGG
jgi:hypothetical protein